MAEISKDTVEAELVEDLGSDVVAPAATGSGLLARLGAELAGTFILVLLGLGTALLLTVTGNGLLEVGLAFGLAAMIAIVAFGGISGAHLNPAVTVGAWVAGRIQGLDVVPYILAQVVGGIAAGGALRLGIGSLKAVDKTAAMKLMSTVSIGYGDHAPLASSGLNWNLAIGLLVEMVATGLLVLVVLSATAKKAPAAIAPFAIGLTLAALVTFAIPFTNAALNPARATASALFSDTWALQELWAWWVAPIVGAAIVGFLFRVFGPAEDLVAVEHVEAE